MAREQQDGARALIVMPVEESALESALADKRVQIPLVLVNAELPRDKVSAVVSTDYDAMGQNLARQALNEHGNQIPYYLFYSSRKSAAQRHFRMAWNRFCVQAAVRSRNLSVTVTEASARSWKSWFTRNPPRQ